MGHLFCNYRLVCGRTDWIAVRRYDTNCPEIANMWGRSWPRIATPTIVHFGAVLLISAVLSAQWQEVTFVAAILDLIGLFGVVYIITVARQMRVQTAYKPEFADWLYYAVLPFAAYAMLALSAFMALSHTSVDLFGVGTAALLLLFIGIHNAWDSIVYLVFYSKQNTNNKRGN